MTGSTPIDFVAQFLNFSDGFQTYFSIYKEGFKMCALVKFGGGVSEMRGKEAGIIYSRNAYGSYVKQKVSPVNPQTSKQLGQRTLMGNLAQTWAALSAGEKASWTNLGEQVTRVNRFGDTTYYTGFGIYMKLNRNIVLAGGTALDEAPTVPEIPVQTITALAADVSSTEINLTMGVTTYAGFVAQVYMTNNILTGRSFVKNYYRLITSIASAGATPYNLYTDWNAYFGNLLVADAKLFLKVKMVHIASGFEGVPVTESTTIIA